MPFRAAFDCLWCGRRMDDPRPDDLEGWAQLCPDCIGRAGENGFLRFRLRAALDERGRAAGAAGAATGGRRRRVADGAPTVVAARPPSHAADPTSTPRWSPTTRRAPASTTTGTSAAVATPAARSTTRPGRPSSTPRRCGSTACRSSGEIVELAAGTGWWSPLLAASGELSIYDAADAPLDRARDRLLAHGCAPTSTSATRGPSRIARSTACSAGSGSATCRATGCRRSSPSLGAGSSRADSSRSSTRGPTPSRAPPTSQRRPRQIGRQDRAAAAGRRPRVPGRQGPLRARRAVAGAARRRVRRGRGDVTDRFFVLGRATA